MKYRFESFDRNNNKRYVVIYDGIVYLTSPSGTLYALSNVFHDEVRLEFEIEKAFTIADHRARVEAFLKEEEWPPSAEPDAHHRDGGYRS